MTLLTHYDIEKLSGWLICVFGGPLNAESQQPVLPCRLQHFVGS